MRTLNRHSTFHQQPFVPASRWPVAHRGFAWLALVVVMALGASRVQAQGLYQQAVTRALRQAERADWRARFLRSQKNVRGFCVKSVDEYIRINAYYDAFVADGRRVHQFRTRFAERIDCIDVHSQGALRGAFAPLRYAPTQIPQSRSLRIAGTKKMPDAQRFDFGLDTSFDAQGRRRACPRGSFPRLIPPREQLYRFASLRDYFQKQPRRKNGSKSLTHIYAHVGRTVDHKGEQADFNLWNQRTDQVEEFSLAQLWVAAGTGADSETVETGWQHYLGRYDDDETHLFIYFNPDAYGEQSCYNLDCGAFVQTDNSVVIAGTLSPTSVLGGEQQSVSLAFVRDNGGDHDWWLKFGDGDEARWVGYYPNSSFDSSGIADRATRIIYGAEIISNPSTPLTGTEMGSGRFPEQGWQYAAYIKKIRYIDMSYVLRNATNMGSSATYPDRWKIGSIYNSSDPNWLIYFYYGGPNQIHADAGLADRTLPDVFARDAALFDVAINDAAVNDVNAYDANMNDTAISDANVYDANMNDAITNEAAMNDANLYDVDPGDHGSGDLDRDAQLAPDAQRDADVGTDAAELRPEDPGATGCGCRASSLPAGLVWLLPGLAFFSVRRFAARRRI